jgi:hypothetical protein
MTDRTNELAELPLRARVALILCFLNRVSTLIDDQSIVGLALHAIDTAWRWEMGEEVSGDALYDSVDALNEPLGRIEKTNRERQVFAMRSIVYGLYYVCWKVVSQGGMDYFLTFPNDLADVTSEYMYKSLEYSAKALGNAPAELKLQSKIALELGSRRTNATDYLGTIIRPEECEAYLSTLAEN